MTAAAAGDDTDSRAGHIHAERYDSDVLHHESMITAAHISRRVTYSEFDQPFEDFEATDDEEYAEEMAYLLAQVFIVYMGLSIICFHFLIL